MNISAWKKSQVEEDTKRLSKDVCVCACVSVCVVCVCVYVHVCLCVCVCVCVFYVRWQEKASLIKYHLSRDLKEMKE